MIYLRNYANTLKYIFKSYIEFKNFSKINYKKFNTEATAVKFPLRILIIIIYKSVINKLNLVFFFNNKKKYEKDFQNIIKKNLYKISQTYFVQNAYHWNEVFKNKKIRKKKLKILEIGSFEGLSTLFFLHNFPNLKLTCVDLWKDNEQDKNCNFSNIEKSFDNNTKKFKKKLEKFKQSSDDFFKENLEYLVDKFDIIYVDGNHNYQFVFKDLKNSFRALKIGGFLIIDDFLNYSFFKDININPIGAIVVFLNIFYRKIKVIKITNQILIKKINN
jgi:SAM-dependent methyltransferase